MVRTLLSCAAALAACVVWVDSGRSEVIVRAPFVVVRVGTPAPGRPVTLVRAEEPPPIPSGEYVPAPRPIAEPVLHPLTLAQFAEGFKPAAGTYEVWLIHPGTECPVKVCFTLPCGCPKVHVTCRTLIFDYGCGKEVRIRMAICGKVRVAEHI
jgi:hypothetical protein